MIRVLGHTLYSLYLIKNSRILAYSLGFSRSEAKTQLEKISKFHKLDGTIAESSKLDKRFEKFIRDKLKCNITPEFVINQLDLYRYNKVYKELLSLKIGTTISYSDLARRTKLFIFQVINALKYNPFIILIPCHRVIKKNGGLSGYTPLGPEFKRILLETERHL